jgi:hypothetical protein
LALDRQHRQPNSLDIFENLLLTGGRHVGIEEQEHPACTHTI